MDPMNGRIEVDRSTSKEDSSKLQTQSCKLQRSSVNASSETSDSLQSSLNTSRQGSDDESYGSMLGKDSDEEGPELLVEAAQTGNLKMLNRLKSSEQWTALEKVKYTLL